MSRPAPKVVLETPSTQKYRTLQIAEAEAIYAVFYEGKPICVKDVITQLNNQVPKYRKSCFNTKGIAMSFARKMNERFDTDKFAVFLMAPAELITE